MASLNCSSSADELFGPAITPDCRGGFDFTLLFEHSILTLLPAVLFLLVFSTRFVYLARAEVKTKRNGLRIAKLVTATAFIAIQATLVILFCQDNSAKISISAASLNLIVSIQFFALSWIEDARSVKPSAVLASYLIFTTLFDLAQARTLWFRVSSNSVLAACFSASIATKVALLFVEAQEKTSYLKEEFGSLPPESVSGIINKSFVWWASSLFRRGFRALIAFDELFELDPDLTSTRWTAKLQQAWETRQQPERQYELVWVICRALWLPMLRAVPSRLWDLGFTFSQPFLISSILGLLLSKSDDPLSNSKGYGLIGATALIYFGMTISSVHYSQAIARLRVIFRGAMVGMIYDRALSIQDGVYDEAAAVTLMSSDTAQISNAITVAQTLWSSVIEIALGLFLLARQLGWVCVMPMIIVFVTSFATSKVAKQIGGHQRTWVAAVQKRVGMTSSVLSEMRSIKMMGLSRLLMEKVQKLRVVETMAMSRFRWDIVWQNVLANFPFLMAAPLTFAVYAIQATAQGSHGALDTNKAFTSLSIINLLTGPVSQLFQSIPSTAAGLGSFERIQKFLIAPPRRDERKAEPEPRDGSSLSIVVSPTSTNNDQDRTVTKSTTLHRLAISVNELNIRPASTAEFMLRSVSFDVKQSSLTMIIGPVASGKSTLLKAILGEGTFDKGIVSVVDRRMAYCGQTPWLPNTTIRKAICGHVSCDQLDEIWYQSCIQSCALDHDFSVLPIGDETIIGSGTTTLSGGQKHRVALARAVYTRASILVLDGVLEALDNNTKKTVVESLLGKNGLLKNLNSTVLLVTHAAEFLSYADNILALSDGTVEFFGPYEEALKKNVINHALDQYPSTGTNGHEERTQSISKKMPFTVPKETDRQDMTRQTGDFTVYKYYLKSIGWSMSLTLVFFVCLETFAMTFSQIWLKLWSDNGGSNLPLYATVYLLLPFITVIALGGFVWSFLIRISPKSSNRLHYILLNTVMSAPQSFFSAIDTGTLLNRFSQDMTLIESTLATGAGVFVANLVRSFANVGLIATGSIYMTATIPAVFIAVYILQHVYLRTSRQLRLLDLETKSPVYTHFLETLNGLATIRAFSWQDDSEAENHRLLDRSQRPAYLLSCSQIWLSLVLSLIVSAEAVLVVALALVLRHSTSPGLLGVSLNNILSFTGSLQMVVQGWTDLETSLGSVARTRDFERDVKPEDKESEIIEPPPSWPDQGYIEFQDVTASHNPNAIALRDISLTIKPGQKVGICGRTGSGKSSLVATVLRLLELDTGTITIDNLSLATMPRSTIRERLVTLPQDPLILPGTVRHNANPHGNATDDAIITVLSRVGVWSALSERGGLDAEISASSLSKGQGQLFGLARAILTLRQGGRKVLLLDEPTANVDNGTDETVQRVLREECAACTVLTVAHRIETILGSDVVVVLEEGRIVEVGQPGGLLKRSAWFAKLVGV